MNYHDVENLFRRYKGQFVDVKTISGGVYEGTVDEITNDFVSLKVKAEEDEPDKVFVLLHSIESVLPRGA